MELPKKLNKPTILEVVTEFRFKNKLEIEEVFYIAKSVLDKKGYTYKKTPILEIPPAIREGDQSLKYATYYIFEKGKNLVHISPYKIAFSNKGFYSGWDDYLAFIVDIYESLNELISKWKFETVSMRYIDFFREVNIFENINIKIDLPESLSNNIKENSKSYSSDFDTDENTKVKIQIANNIQLNNTNNVETGSIIDIDVFLNLIKEDYKSSLNDIHSLTKKTFFDILNDNFIESLEPEYN